LFCGVCMRYPAKYSTNLYHHRRLKNFMMPHTTHLFKVTLNKALEKRGFQCSIDFELSVVRLVFILCGTQFYLNCPVFL
jgi:hypothetical protein